MPRLSESARHIVLPGTATTSGFPALQRRGRELGFLFDDWQEGIGSHALSKDCDGVYTATVGGVVLSICRQTGKTHTVGSLVFLLCEMIPGLTVIWTAHHNRTATKTFQKMKSWGERDAVRPLMDEPRNANGEQELRFLNGSVILFGSRKRGFGRGFDEVDIEVFDEAQILESESLEDMIAATNQSRRPEGGLLFFMGTPPKPKDPGEEFSSRRAKALGGESDGMIYIEFSADDDADPDDPDQWAVANPSFPGRTSRDAMRRLRANLTSDEAFLREALGIWALARTRRVIPQVSWDAQGEIEFSASGRFALGVAVAPDLVSASVCLAGTRPDGKWQFTLVEQHPGVAWLLPWLRFFLENNPQVRSVAADVGGPIKAILDEMPGQRWRFTDNSEDAGSSVWITAPRASEMATACTVLLSGIVTGDIFHTDQLQMNSAAGAAGKRAHADSGLWFWSLKNSSSDISPIQAGTLALFAAQREQANAPIKSSRTPGSKPGGRRVRVLA